MIILAAAVGLNNELGRESGEPLWNLPDEYARFRASIRSHSIIMGRKSFDVIGKPLEDSLNIVITRQEKEGKNGEIIVHNLGDAIKKAGSGKDIYVIGGGEIFEIAIKVADKMELSRIDGLFSESTVFFPEFSEEKWGLISAEKQEKDERHAYSFTYEIWIRK